MLFFSLPTSTEGMYVVFVSYTLQKINQNSLGKIRMIVQTDGCITGETEP